MNYNFFEPMNEFDEYGHLPQVQRASRAAESTNSAVGVKGEGVAVIVLQTHNSNPLLVSSTTNALFQIDDGLGAAFVGLGGDARPLANVGQSYCANHRFELGEPASINTVASKMADRMQNATMAFGSRPFGVAFLLAGAGKLIHVSTDASLQEVKAAAIGHEISSAREFLEANYATAKLDTRDAVVDFALKALSQRGPLSADDIEIIVVGSGTGYRKLTKTEKQAALQRESSA